MKTLFRNFIAFTALIAIVYFVTNYYGSIQETIGVKGMSTQKAQEITKDINKDISKEIHNAGEKIGEIKISDIIAGLSRFQKIPQDFTNTKEYIEEQIELFRNKEKK